MTSETKSVCVSWNRARNCLSKRRKLSNSRVRGDGIRAVGQQRHSFSSEREKYIVISASISGERRREDSRTKTTGIRNIFLRFACLLVGAGNVFECVSVRLDRLFGEQFYRPFRM